MWQGNILKRILKRRDNDNKINGKFWIKEKRKEEIYMGIEDRRLRIFLKNLKKENLNVK